MAALPEGWAGAMRADLLRASRVSRCASRLGGPTKSFVAGGPVQDLFSPCSAPVPWGGQQDRARERAAMRITIAKPRKRGTPPLQNSGMRGLRCAGEAPWLHGYPVGGQRQNSSKGSMSDRYCQGASLMIMWGGRENQRVGPGGSMLGDGETVHGTVRIRS